MSEDFKPYTALTKEEREKEKKRKFEPLRPWFCPRCGSMMQPQDDYYLQLSQMCELCYIEANRGFRPKSLYDKDQNIIKAETKEVGEIESET